ncbi:MAG: hypothetical protein GY809_16690, partial [Planctomycetes bacterium]|nr:hypothetical protein [Planctomycetota bacterium]
MIDQMNAMAQQWFAWQWDMLWQSAVLIAIIAIVDRLIRKWAWPQLRYALWLLVLVKLILPPTLSSPVSVTTAMPTWVDQVQIVPVNTEPEIPLSNTALPVPAVSEVQDFQAETASAESVPFQASLKIAEPALSW